MKKSVVEPESFDKSTDDKDILKHGTPIIWERVTYFVALHISFIYAWSFIFQVKRGTFNFSSVLVFLSMLGTTAGAHRLWAHRAYKARLPLRLFLVVLQTLAFQLSVIDWCRDHRLHHKLSDTDADPHNSNRGFFFSHMGWLMCKRSEIVRNARKTVDSSDLEADPVLLFQKRLVYAISIGLPIMIPVLLFDESYLISFLFAFVCRQTAVYHFTWLVNSAAHLWGNRPYDKYIKPRQNIFISWVALGEGYHNYHHTFPWDYSTSELGSRVNATTAFINIMAFCGQAYDLKKPNPEMIKNRCRRTGENNDVNTRQVSNSGSRNDELGDKFLQPVFENQLNLRLVGVS